MSVASPTVMPRGPIFPTLLPKPPQPPPLPLPKFGQQRMRMNAIRDLVREMDDLSDEEDELDDLLTEVRNRGFTFIVPIGRMLTQNEEKNDADEDGDEDDDDDDGDDDGDSDEEEEGSEESENSEEDEDEDEEQDLDAEMEDLDEDMGNITAETAPSDDMDAEDASSEP